jgi:hypothetical protein
MAKDGGLTPGQLAAVLAEWTFGPDVEVPGDVPITELEAYRRELIRRLTRRAFPKGSS